MLLVGQSAVLYSRLGIVLGPGHQNILKAVKWMVIIDGLILHILTTVLMYGTYQIRTNRAWARGFRVAELLQRTVYTIQELIISCLYVWRTVDFLRVVNDDRRKSKRIMRELLAVYVCSLLSIPQAPPSHVPKLTMATTATSSS